jgi:hypothetical protein
MRKIAFAAMRMGLIEPDVIKQFQRWGGIPRDMDTSVVEEPEVALELVQDALESEEYVRLQDTDLDLLKFWLNTDNQRKGQLTLVDMHTGQKAVRSILFARREVVVTATKKLVEYVLPWVSESIIDILTNGLTYLKYTEGETKNAVYFGDVREMYFGDVKAFMVCTATEDQNVSD